MAYKAQLDHMRTAVAETLQATGDFSVIEPEYRFGSARDANVLNQQRARHIYCELKPELTELAPEGCSGKILVNVHHTNMNGPLFVDQLVAATMQDIHTANILHRYINSMQSEESQGPLFRRFVLEEEREDDVKYRERAVYNQHSILNSYLNIPNHVFTRFQKQFPEHTYRQLVSEILENSSLPTRKKDDIRRGLKRVNGFRRLRRLERDWVYSASPMNMPLYFQPESARLKQAIKRYRLRNVKRSSEDRFGRSQRWNASHVFEPEVMETFASFTLRPYRKTDRFGTLAKHFAGSVKRGRLPYRVDEIPRHLLLADLVGISGIEVEDGFEREIRYKIGLLTRAINLGFDHEELADRLCMQLQHVDSEEDTTEAALTRNIETLLKHQQKQGIKQVLVPSESRTGLLHTVTRTTNPETGDMNYDCSCEDYLLRVRPKRTSRTTCKHMDGVME